MTTTYYASVNDYGTIAAEVAHAGTSSTSTDVFEFRMGNGTVVPTREECLLALDVIALWIRDGGQDQAGANLPPETNGTGM